MGKNIVGSVHIHYSEKEKPYHKTVANLVAKYIDYDKAYIVDVGCGLGHTLLRIKKLLPESKLIAVDIDQNCVDATKGRVSLFSSIKISNLEELFKHQVEYNAVVMSHVLEHTLDPVSTIKGLMGMIKPGGFLVLAVPNPVRPAVFVAALRRRHYVNKGHVYSWDRSHWINFLENIMGLDVIYYASDYLELPFLKRWVLFRKLGEHLVKYFPWLSFSNIAVIRKASSDKESN